jgi:hypothetical protein
VHGGVERYFPRGIEVLEDRKILDDDSKGSRPGPHKNSFKFKLYD